MGKVSTSRKSVKLANGGACNGCTLPASGESSQRGTIPPVLALRDPVVAIVVEGKCAQYPDGRPRIVDVTSQASFVEGYLEGNRERSAFSGQTAKAVPVQWQLADTVNRQGGILPANVVLGDQVKPLTAVLIQGNSDNPKAGPITLAHIYDRSEVAAYMKCMYLLSDICNIYTAPVAWTLCGPLEEVQPPPASKRRRAAR